MQTDDIIWQWDKSPKRRRISLHIDHQGALWVKTPMRTSIKIIEQFIKEKSGWIKKHQSTQQNRIHPLLPEFASVGTLWFRGVRYPFETQVGKNSSVDFDESRFVITVRSQASFARTLSHWYKQQTQAYVTQAMSHLDQRIQKVPKSIGYRRYKRRWGSCDRNNNLMFNTLLSMHKDAHMLYVVAHELAHMQEKHHKKAFWEEGERILEGFNALHRSISLPC